MNRLVTSKLISRSVSSRVVSQIFSTKWVEFLTNKLVCPAKGEGILASSLDKLYAGGPIPETIALKGTLSVNLQKAIQLWGHGCSWYQE